MNTDNYHHRITFFVLNLLSWDMNMKILLLETFVIENNLHIQPL